MSTGMLAFILIGIGGSYFLSWLILRLALAFIVTVFQGLGRLLSWGEK